MSQTIAVVLPLPVVLALGAVVLLLLALSAVLVAMRKPARLRTPDWVHGREPQRDDNDPHPFRLGRLEIEGLSELQGPSRRDQA